MRNCWLRFCWKNCSRCIRRNSSSKLGNSSLDALLAFLVQKLSKRKTSVGDYRFKKHSAGIMVPNETLMEEFQRLFQRQKSLVIKDKHQWIELLQNSIKKTPFPMSNSWSQNRGMFLQQNIETLMDEKQLLVWKRLKDEKFSCCLQCPADFVLQISDACSISRTFFKQKMTF